MPFQGWFIWSWQRTIVQSLSHVWLFSTPWTAARQVSLSFTVSRSLLKIMSIIRWWYLTISSSANPFSFAFSLSQHHVLSSESALLIGWPKDWSITYTVSPSSEYSELISFRIDRFDLLAVQGMLKSLLQRHSLKASVLHHSTFMEHTWLLEKP